MGLQPEDVIARASPDLLAQLRSIAEVSAAVAVPVWLVGGLVRDLLLERASTDIDLVTLEAPGEFARLLVARLGGEVTEHSRFLTARLVTEGGFVVDLVRARAETYDGPAEPPRVRPGTLEDDLFRRDFSVNAMAILLGDPEAKLIDPFKGHRDLQSGRLRVMHEESFLDDPSRVARGIRLAVDLGFEFDDATAELAREAAAGGAFELLSGERRRRDLARVLVDPARAVGAVERGTRLGFDAYLHPELALLTSSLARLQRLADREPAIRTEEKEPQWWLANLILLAWELPDRQRLELANRLALRREERRELVSARDRVEAAAACLEARESTPSARYAAVARLGTVQRILLQAFGGSRVGTFFAEEWPRLRGIRLGISGEELVARGYPPGRTIGQALDQTLQARLEGRISPEDELDFALAWLEEKSGD